MSQHDYVIGNDDGASVRADINSMAAAVKSGNSDPASAPASPVQGMYYRKLLSATCQESWEYDGAAWRITHIINPTSGRFSPAGVRAISGLTLSNNGTDATNDIDIAAGVTCADSDGCPLLLDSAITKRLDANWAVGTNQGGLDTGAIANTTYHVWLIRRPDTGVVDVLFSASASSPTMPTNYTQKRRIGSIIRSGGAIRLFKQSGDRFMHDAPIGDYAGANPGTARVTVTLTVPLGIIVSALIKAEVSDATVASQTFGLVTALTHTDTTPSSSAFNMRVGITANIIIGHLDTEMQTNTSAQISYRISQSTADHTVLFQALGWIDRRGQDA